MDNNADNKQTVILEGRKKLTVNEVIAVESFNDDYLEISSKAGIIAVEGESMRIEELLQGSGKITVIGSINGFFYREDRSRKGMFSKKK